MMYSFHSNSPEITVLMSCYNASRWLHEAIDSVLKQTFENFEFILVDDGSTDETWNIIQSHSKQDKRIVAISRGNIGLTDSLNFGIAKARGSWIARLDADDLWEPARLEEQINFVRAHPEVVLLGTGCIEIDEQGRFIKKHLYPSGHNKLVRHLERLKRFFPHSSAFFRREIAQAVGCYNTSFRKSQDWHLWLRLAERGRIACLNKYLIKVRKHSGQLSNSGAGMSQLAYGMAATVCHLLLIASCPDPSANGDEANWHEFIAWINRRMMKEGTYERYKIWTESRAAFFAATNSLTGFLHFAANLLKSGHAYILVWEKLFGSSMPQRLAREWMQRPCAVQ